MANNINPELEQIRNGHYGSDIRMAIHDAIDKLNIAIENMDGDPETRGFVGHVGVATFTAATAEERIKLYDETLTEEQITYQLRVPFWDSMTNTILPEGFYADYGSPVVDENGQLGLGFTITDERDPNNIQLILGAAGDGCGVFNLYEDGNTSSTFGDKLTGQLHVSGNQWLVGYKAKHGFMILIRDFSNPEAHFAHNGVIIIGKTNDGEVCWLGSPANGDLAQACAVKSYIGSRTDDATIPSIARTLTYGFMPNGDISTANVLSGETVETVLCAVPVHSRSGEMRYMQGIYAMPWSQHRNIDGILMLGGRRYITNGYFAILDE